jgi:membrane-associated phospholipid phosphatase
MDSVPVHRRVTVAAIVAAIVSLLAFAALTVVAVMPALHGLDRDIGTAVQEARHPRLESPMRMVTFLGDGWMLFVLTLATWLALRLRRDRLARRFPLIMVGSVVTEFALKWLVARPRPRGSLSSVPSGHVFTAAAFFGAIVYLLWTRDIPRPWRILGTAACILIVVGIGVSRLYLKFHWLTDVLGGVTGGTAYVLMALILADRRSGSTDAT